MQSIIIAEDEAGCRATMVRAVEQLDVFPIEASSGKRAWEILLDNPQTTLLVTDMMMPDMNGRELIKAVRNHEKLSHIPIIIVSGVLLPNDINDLLLLGCSRFLPKPLNIDDFKHYINLLKDNSGR